jgi:hypothetical protein
MYTGKKNPKLRYSRYGRDFIEFFNLHQRWVNNAGNYFSCSSRLSLCKAITVTVFIFMLDELIDIMEILKVDEGDEKGAKTNKWTALLHF